MMFSGQERSVGPNDAVTSSKSLDSTDVDWRESKTVGECLSHLCLSQHLSDITFTFKNHQNVQLPAHKFVLSMRSSVFETMFHGPLAESGDTVLIEDIDPETMKDLLRFLYSDKPIITGNNVLHLLYAAKKYALTGLVKQCSSFQESKIDSSNVCAIHEQAVFYNMNSLEGKCFDYMLENANEVLASQGFIEVSHSTLLKLLEHEDLTEDEVNVFQAAIKWTKNKCESENVASDPQHMRERLGKALFAIRFPTMSIGDFAKLVTPTKVLTSEEQVMLFHYFAIGDSRETCQFPRGQRSGKIVSINIHKLSNLHHHHYEGYQLHIKEDRQRGDTCTNRWNVKLKSIKGRFVKYIGSINCSSEGNTIKFIIKENMILFENPLEITTYGTSISFNNPIPRHSYTGEFRLMRQCETEYRLTEYISRKISYDINKCQRVLGKSICITRIPDGMETITFVK